MVLFQMVNQNLSLILELLSYSILLHVQIIIYDTVPISMNFDLSPTVSLCSISAVLYIEPICSDSFNMSGISMQRLNKKEWKLLELQFAQCKHAKGGVDVIMSKCNTLKI